jgi:hypothetical protein
MRQPRPARRSRGRGLAVATAVDILSATFALRSPFIFDDAVDAPAYGQEAPVPRVAMFGCERANGDRSPTDSEDDRVPWPIVTMLLGGAAIFGTMGAVALGWSRRRRR